MVTLHIMMGSTMRPVMTASCLKTLPYFQTASQRDDTSSSSVSFFFSFSSTSDNTLDSIFKYYSDICLYFLFSLPLLPHNSLLF